jgi:multidrug efflux pump subunit AcrB
VGFFCPTSAHRESRCSYFSLPFALVGAVVAAFLTGGVLSLGSPVGLVTVIGISARNGVMLISH